MSTLITQTDNLLLDFLSPFWIVTRIFEIKPVLVELLLEALQLVLFLPQGSIFG